MSLLGPFQTKNADAAPIRAQAVRDLALAGINDGIIADGARNCPPDAATAHRLVDGFLDIAGRDIATGLTVAEMAHALGTSATELHQACMMLRGARPLDLLYELRLQRAIAMIEAGETRMDRIADATGFCSLMHMNRTFVASTGRTPASFRDGRLGIGR